MLVFCGPEAVAADTPQPVHHPDLGHEHIPNPLFPHARYNSSPPSSGPHTSYTADWGVHQKPVADEILIHNLEHGGIVIAHRCGDCPDLVSALEDLADGYEMIIIAPNPTVVSPIGLAAWGVTLSLERLDDAGKGAVADFIKKFHGIDHHPPGGHLHTAPPATDSH